MRLPIVLWAAVFTLCASFARAQNYPSRPVRVLVPLPPAGALDNIVRSVTQRLAQALGQSFVIDNRPGAGGNLSLEIAAAAAPDGHTLVMGAVATHAINPWLFAKLPYDPIRDFTPITRVAQVPNVLVLNAETAHKLGIASLADLVAFAKKNPGRLNYGSGGNGSAGHLAGEMFKAQAGLFMVHIPYAGGNPAQLGLLAGQVDLSFDNLASASANIKSGRLRALAVTTAVRASAMPDLPTIAEAGRSLGLGGFDVGTWFGLFGPAGLPAEMLARLNKAFVAALDAPETKTRMAQLLAEPSPTTPDQFAAFVKAELAKYGPVVKASGAKVE